MKIIVSDFLFDLPEILFMLKLKIYNLCMCVCLKKKSFAESLIKDFGEK